MYNYKAKIIDVYDGDTVTAMVDLGFLHFQEMKLRLYGIDTPELRGEEREQGIIVRDILREMVLGKEVTIRSYKDKQGKYGRYLANIILEDGLEVNQWLVDNGHAKEYYP
ncbi:micrococcal nuclease [Mesoflavibacter sabulilitoris]|jgi:micrococcal nuclease|uniref:Nuclease n=1 Tax=Mesoflavibacter zeaxanthinifaciens subsp. sabulilitoris TaxID=1520893 RepID=A0A2T1N813_9FLAO|nr:thermonuclease family protein [Mesoflavibacter zeaxanthinifaciens]MBB3123838.1 micrococcal nuclease [Mesoflavibacter zeaxanthinifaciens subsp. sabulilitoris]MCP4051976.1 thermonuclease family protein [Mesoflavibacter sp.]PSG87982.1 nuclease [Mesoflavibacter zeaxanthinifaciens subsp. sabulilitoris]|tara:strand:+ start:391 stop:720 length:330 start_codon:yes stop_codon:yes gene_type:complete